MGSSHLCGLQANDLSGDEIPTPQVESREMLVQPGWWNGAQRRPEFQQGAEA